MNISRVVVRQLTTSPPVRSGKIHEGYFKIRDMQKKFQEPDGKPVFLKGGPMDRALYGLTIALTLAGVAGMGQLFYQLTFPKPN